jgi:hypothetical protein
VIFDLFLKTTFTFLKLSFKGYVSLSHAFQNRVG